jgi:hypothetical protein
MGQGVRSQRQKSVARLAYKEFFKGSVERNMDHALGQRRKEETLNVINHDTTRNLLCKFYDPKEGKLGGFFTFRESEKM